MDGALLLIGDVAEDRQSPEGDRIGMGEGL